MILKNQLTWNYQYQFHIYLRNRQLSWHWHKSVRSCNSVCKILQDRKFWFRQWQSIPFDRVIAILFVHWEKMFNKNFQRNNGMKLFYKLFEILRVFEVKNLSHLIAEEIVNNSIASATYKIPPVRVTLKALGPRRLKITSELIFCFGWAIR